MDPNHLNHYNGHDPLADNPRAEYEIEMAHQQEKEALAENYTLRIKLLEICLPKLDDKDKPVILARIDELKSRLVNLED